MIEINFKNILKIYSVFVFVSLMKRVFAPPASILFLDTN